MHKSAIEYAPPHRVSFETSQIVVDVIGGGLLFSLFAAFVLVVHSRQSARMLAADVTRERPLKAGELGTSSELGITQGQLVFASLLSFTVVGFYIYRAMRRRPWWRRDALIETEHGVL